MQRCTKSFAAFIRHPSRGLIRGLKTMFRKYLSLFNYKWRREWDSNPRYGFPHTRFPSVRLKPLGHLS
jgi:hypothetical protein